MNMLRMWNRLVMMEEDQLTKQAFSWDYNNRGTWCTQIENVCEKLSISYVFLNQLSVDMKDIENKLNEHTYNIWKEGLPSFPKLRT